jgi:hypothetical protein
MPGIIFGISDMETEIGLMRQNKTIMNDNTIRFRLLDLEQKGSTRLRNVGRCSSNDTASCPSSLDFSRVLK